MTSTEAEVAALADAHGSVIKGIEQLLSPLVGKPCFRLKLLCGDAVMNEDAALKLPLELQVAVCDLSSWMQATLTGFQTPVKQMTLLWLRPCCGALKTQIW